MSSELAFETVPDADLWSLGGGNDGSLNGIIRDVLATTRTLSIVSKNIVNNTTNINGNNNVVINNTFIH